MKSTQEQINEKHSEIIEAKNGLYGTDYIGHKAIDAIIGVLTDPSPTITKMATAVKQVLADYPEYQNTRQSERADINTAQANIKQLEAQKQQEEAERPLPIEPQGEGV